MLRHSHYIALVTVWIVGCLWFLEVQTLSTESDWPFLNLLWVCSSMLHIILCLLQGLALKDLKLDRHLIHLSLVCVSEIELVRVVEVIIVFVRSLLLRHVTLTLWLPISLVESVRDLDVLLSAPCSYSRWKFTSLHSFIYVRLRDRLFGQVFQLPLVPHLLEVGDPISCYQRLFEEVVSSLDLRVDSFSSLETTWWLAGYHYSSYLNLHDWKMAQALVKASDDGHGWLELLFRGLGLANLEEGLVVDHIIKYTEQFLLIEELLETLCNSIVLL